MTLRPPPFLAAVLFCAFAVLVPDATAAGSPACSATALRAPADPRIGVAVQEARRQHALFGGQTVERDGGMFRVGASEAESSVWRQVAVFWQALSESEPPTLVTSVGRVARAEIAAPSGGGASSRTDVAVQEALLRAAILDTPWSAAFISYLMKTAGFTRDEFAFSDSHSEYVRQALATSEAEAAGHGGPSAFRACDVATTRPRAGDLLCATRAGTTGTRRFDALPAAMAAAGQPFPMHCDLVVRSDDGGDAKIDSIGGNVVNSVTLSRMTLNADKVLSAGYLRPEGPQADCADAAPACRDHLSRRPWLVLLQLRH